MKQIDRDGWIDNIAFGIALIIAILLAGHLIGCTTITPKVSYESVNSSIASARDSLTKARMVLTNCDASTLLNAQTQLSMAGTRLNLAEQLLAEQAKQVLELEKATQEIPKLQLKVAEQRGTIWKLILITSGVVLATIGIFIFRQALLNIPVIGWGARLLGL